MDAKELIKQTDKMKEEDSNELEIEELEDRVRYLEELEQELTVLRGMEWTLHDLRGKYSGTLSERKAESHWAHKTEDAIKKRINKTTTNGRVRKR